MVQRCQGPFSALDRRPPVLHLQDGIAVGVEITIAADKKVKLREQVQAFGKATLIARKALKEFAGLVAWVASVVPVMRPFSAMLWAAAVASPRGQETPTMVHFRRVLLPLRWLLAFANEEYLDAPRRFMHREPPLGPRITFDASLTGGGAFLELPVDGVLVVQEYFTCKWTPMHHAR